MNEEKEYCTCEGPTSHTGGWTRESNYRMFLTKCLTCSKPIEADVGLIKEEKDWDV